MKRKISFLFALLCCALFVSAQIKEFPNGNVGIGVGNNTLQSKFVIGNSPGRSDFRFAMYTDNATTSGLYVERGTQRSTWAIGIYGDAGVTSGSTTIGLQGTSRSLTPANTGRAYGVLGHVGNATDGYNYGVVGLLDGTVGGSGIVGSVSGLDLRISGRYAGYFIGNVKVTGTINGTLINNSDIRYKKNIKELSDVNKRALDKVLLLNPVEYNLNQIYEETASDTATVRYAYFDENSQEFQKKQFGLIAQEVQQIYPDLVYEGDNGYLGINYTGLIPILIQSIKELNEEVETLKASKNVTGNTNIESEIGKAVLHQNAPNPSSGATEIAYYLPQNTNNAFLCIYDMQGKQLKQITLTQRGNGKETISASEFTPGIYLYALVADGNEVAVKRMILTK